jgi:hypothetical protein
MSMEQMPARGNRVDGDTLMPLIAGAVAGVVTFTLSSSFLIAAGVTVLVGGLAYTGLALRNQFRKNR